MVARPRVGVRELRQNLSVYLRRVRAGESLEVTERGHAVALLTPLPEHADPIARLVAAGRLIPPQGDLLEIEPLPSRSGVRPLSEVVGELRSDRI